MTPILGVLVGGLRLKLYFEDVESRKDFEDTVDCGEVRVQEVKTIDGLTLFVRPSAVSAYWTDINMLVGP